MKTLLILALVATALILTACGEKPDGSCPKCGYTGLSGINVWSGPIYEPWSNSLLYQCNRCGYCVTREPEDL